jgi:hypothetical protein
MHDSNVCIEWCREGKTMAIQMRLNWEEEERKVKNGAPCKKVKNYGAHNTRSQTLHIMHLT